MTSDADVTIAQLRAWAGEATFNRGQSYMLRGRVRDLSATPDGALVAWVQGSKRYATRVFLHADQIVSGCTCHYGSSCKHAVAVALAYLTRTEQAKSLPVVPASDPRLVLLESQAVIAPGLITHAGTTVTGKPALAAFLAAYSQDELVSLLVELAQRFPEVRDALAVRQMLADDNADQLEAEVLRRLIAITAEPAWRGHWHGADHAPDYGPVHAGLRLLLARDHNDAVVRLGDHLLEAGISQVEQSHDDDGRTASAVSECLSIVFQALPASSLEPAAQLTWAINALLRDPYDMCYGAHAVLESSYPPAVWSTVADSLLSRLADLPPTAGDFSHEYRRQKVTDFAILALEAAGRDEEIIPLCEHEAAAGSGYERLIERLLAAGRLAEAEQWARTGIGATARQYPGIATALREVLCTLRGEVGDWAMVAALRAEAFFASPSFGAMRALEATAAQAGVAPAVRAAALHYLESGQLPQWVAHTAGGTNNPPWPLPETGIPPTEQRYLLQFPQLRTLIELAISEGQPTEVLRWYDRRSPAQYSPVDADVIADAVAEAYPERAASIWQELAEERIAQTKPAAYEEAALYLRKLRRMWTEHGKAAEWRSYTEKLGAANKRKRRLIETLDVLLRERG
jgi:uncharacterized Zn finger protein